MNKNMKEKCKNCEILESGSIIKVELNGDCIFCGRNLHTQFVPQKHMNNTDKILELKEMLDDPRTGLKDSSNTNKTRYGILALFETAIAQALAEEREIKVDLKQILKEQANWKHPNFGIIAEFVSGLGENGVVNYKVIKNT